MTIDEFKKQYDTIIVKNINKVVVKEVDEVSKGNYVGYVDAGNDTYDVSIQKNEKEIKSVSCDCNSSNPYCLHIVMMLNHIINANEPKDKIKKTRISKIKTSPAQQLLKDIEIADLKKWLLELFDNNKNIQLEFINYFTKDVTEYNPQLVESKLKEVIKVVAKNKKKVEQGELKKIIDLWTLLSNSLLEYCISNITDIKPHECIIKLNDVCLDYYASIETNSVKVSKYVEGIFIKFTEPLNNIYQQNSWQSIIDFYAANIVTQNHWRELVLDFMFNLTNISGNERKVYLNKKLLAYLQLAQKGNYEFANRLSLKLLKIIVDNNWFLEYKNQLNTIMYANDYNLFLIEQYIQHNFLNEAEKLCKIQFANNYKQEYNIPYQKLLQTINIKQDNKQEEINIARDLLLYSFNIEEFKRVYTALNGEEKSKWKTKVLSKAKNSFNRFSENKEVVNFYYGILDFDGNYAKMLNDYEFYNHPSIVLTYFDKLFQKNKQSFLVSILQKLNNSSFYTSDKESIEMYNVLADKMIEHYDREVLIANIISVTTNKYFIPRSKGIISVLMIKLDMQIKI